MMRTLSCLALALLAGSCDGVPPPAWFLMETGTTSDTVRAVWRAPSGTVYAGLGNGRLLRRPKSSNRFDDVSLIDIQGKVEDPGPLQGITGRDEGELYARTDNALWHSTGGSFRALGLPAGATAWHPHALVTLEADHVVLAAEVTTASVPRNTLLDGQARVFLPARGPTAESLPELTWVAGSTETPVLAGDASRARVRLSAERWESVNAMDFGRIRTAAVTDSHLLVLTEDGVRGSRLDTLQGEDKDATLNGGFNDLCAFPDGRAAVVGPARFPTQPLWVWEGGTWRNVNVGTHETLVSVQCASNGKILAGGTNGMLAVEP